MQSSAGDAGDRNEHPDQASFGSLAEFFTSVEGQERPRKQHLKDLATKRAAEPKRAKAVVEPDCAI